MQAVVAFLAGSAAALVPLSGRVPARHAAARCIVASRRTAAQSSGRVQRTIIEPAASLRRSAGTNAISSAVLSGT